MSKLSKMIFNQGVMYSKENLCENSVYKTNKSRAVLGTWWDESLRSNSHDLPQSLRVCPQSIM